MTWNTSSPYSNEDVIKLQQDAIKRVTEMQKRASKTLEQANNSVNIPPPIPSTPHFAMPPVNYNGQYRGQNNTNTHRNNFNQNNTYNPTINYVSQNTPINNQQSTINATNFNQNISDNKPLEDIPQQNQNTNHNRNNHQQKQDSSIKIPEILKSIPLLNGKGISSLTSLLDTIGLDSEKLILLALIFLLSNEGADKTLILALGYLLF